jgi:hypothetical protein
LSGDGKGGCQEDQRKGNREARGGRLDGAEIRWTWMDHAVDVLLAKMIVFD